MCGIAGFIDPVSGAYDPQRVLDRMAASVMHRGPDSCGRTWDQRSCVGLAHARLAVVDLSVEGHQPMASASERFSITYNGEVYNHLELRRVLERAGHRFRGHSDTEVFLQAVEEWGLEGALERARGMFAFALHDSVQRTLYLGRDRLGEKPLYYGLQAGALMFASDLRALRCHPRFGAAVDRESLALLMRYQYIPAPRSIYEGIRKVIPGTVLAFDTDRPSDDGRLIEYWSVEAAILRGRESPFGGSEAEALDELQQLLTESVREKIVADVPVGAFLSGGVDSSLVVATMQRVSDIPVRTFSIGFSEAGHDEAPRARAIAKHLGTDHEEAYVAPEDALAVIPRLPEYFSEPFADSSQIPTYLVAHMARRKVTVSLSGDGGDELFGGYKWYGLTDRLWRNAGYIPRGLRRRLGAFLAGRDPKRLSRLFGWADAAYGQYGQTGAIGQRLVKLGSLLGSPDVRTLYAGVRAAWVQTEALVIGSNTLRAPITDRSPELEFGITEEQLSYLDLISYLPDDILTKVDRATMAASLESRIPFLDHRLVEFAWRLPYSLKVRHGVRKWPLRELLRRHVPQTLIPTQKSGFSIPLDDWLRGPLREWGEDLLDGTRLKNEGYLEPTRVEATWGAHCSGEQDRAAQLWPVLMFQSWMESQSSYSATGVGPGERPVELRSTP